jgi:hypothetical protein
MRKAIYVPAALAVLALLSCLPNPQSVKENREKFDRSAVRQYITDKPPAIKYPNKGEFDHKIRLLGYNLEPEVLRPGDAFTITYYFEALEEIDEHWQLFVHIDGSTRIHGDHHPVRGMYPTEVWRKGEIIADVQKMDVPANFASTSAAIYIGFYMDERRMPISNLQEARNDGQNRLEAGQLRVIQSF